MYLVKREKHPFDLWFTDCITHYVMLVVINVWPWLTVFHNRPRSQLQLPLILSIQKLIILLNMTLFAIWIYLLLMICSGEFQTACYLVLSVEFVRVRMIHQSTRQDPTNYWFQLFDSLVTCQNAIFDHFPCCVYHEYSICKVDVGCALPFQICLVRRWKGRQAGKWAGRHICKVTTP